MIYNFYNWKLMMLHSIKLLFTAIILAAPPPNPDPTLAPFYQGLRQPGTTNSCCSIADCRTVQYRTQGDHFEIFISKKTFTDGTDEWVPVPKEVVLPPQTNPTGEGVACWTPYRGVMCFLESSGT